MKSKRYFLWFSIPVIILAVLLVRNIGDLLPSGIQTESSEKKLSGALQALDFWAAQRAYPHPVIPDVGFAAAFEEVRHMKLRGGNVIDESVDPWTALGPANIGGRTLALALHPNDPDVIFAGSASGGLWKSTTGGVGAEAWTHVETGFPVLGVSTIAIDPADPDVMYIGTGEVYAYQESTGGEVIRTTRGSYGIGILKSTDGGATWSMSLDWSYSQTRGVWMIALHPTTSSTLYAATSEGVYKSTDSGQSWVLVHDVIMATDVRIHPTNPEIIFAACGNFSSEGHGIYRSQNAGADWQKLSTGLPSSWSGKVQLAIAPTMPNRIYASIADYDDGRGLYKSTNTGDTWQLVNSTDYPQYQGWYSHYVLVSPFDADDLFVGGIEIWRSHNAGSDLEERSDWTEIYFGTSPPEGPIGGPHYAHADHHFAVWHPTDPNTIFFASDGGVFKTTNGADTFESLIGGYMTTQFYNGFSNSAYDPEKAIGGMQDNLTAIYQGSNAWRRVIGGDGSWTAINTQDDQTMYGSYQYLGILRSRDGGNDWTNVSPQSQSGDQTAFIAPYVLSPSHTTRLYAGRSRLYRSDNEGSDWLATNGGAPLDPSFNPVLSLAVSWTNPDIVYAGVAPINSRARVFRTTNGGADWDDVTGVLPDRYPSDLAVDPNDPTVVYVTFMGYGNSHLFRSTDAGKTWDDIGDGLPDVPASAVTVDPVYPDVLYVGTDLGVFVSPDAGQSWLTFQSGMPTAMVNDLKVYGPWRLLRAATHGNGVFQRDLFDPTTVGVPALPTLQAGLRVHPNPIQPGSRVFFDLPRAGSVRLTLFDVHGRRVASLLEGTRDAGAHEVPLARGQMAPGVYFLRLETQEGVRNTRIVFMD
jgi:photosystem II stability/assembly factor-like uncharacterized protein